MQKVKKLHKSNIEEIRKSYKHVLSSHAFSSLYLWQYAMKLSLECGEDSFVLKCGMKGENAWFFPCGKEQKTYDFLSEHMQEKDFSLCYLREEDVKWLEEKFPNKWEFHRMEECDEYIGDIAEYLSLEGSKFSEIRRKIRKIDREYQITSVVITDENIIDAMAVVSRWRNAHFTSTTKCTNTSFASVGDFIPENDCDANRDKLLNPSDKNVTFTHFKDENVAETALSERELLEVSGIILYANDLPVCVFAGFPLSEDTIDVLIGKSVPDAPKGIAYYGLREYLKLCGTGYTYCNHEEDLGIPGIRQMKTSLCPVFKVPIWEAVLK